MSRQYDPIPIPFHQRLKQFRVQILPVLVFLSVGVVVVMLWEQKMSSPGFIGKVVGEQSLVSSPGDGVLIDLETEEFSTVSRGQRLGQLFRSDSTYIQAQMNAIQAEINYLRQSLDPIIGDQRSRIDYEELKIEEIQKKIDLGSLQIEKQQAESDFNRALELRKRDLISEQEFELSQTRLNLLQDQVEETTALIEHLGNRLNELEETGRLATRSERDPLLAAIEVLEKELDVILAETGPLSITAPIDGVISMMKRKQNEYVSAGDSIFVIESMQPRHILGYIRQPFTVDPEVGMEVEIRSRKPQRQFFISSIEEIGGHIRMIEPNMQRPGAMFESGLPVKVSIPENVDMALTPGEIVDIVLRPGRDETMR